MSLPPKSRTAAQVDRNSGMSLFRACPCIEFNNSIPLLQCGAVWIHIEADVEPPEQDRFSEKHLRQALSGKRNYASP